MWLRLGVDLVLFFRFRFRFRFRFEVRGAKFGVRERTIRELTVESYKLTALDRLGRVWAFPARAG